MSRGSTRGKTAEAPLDTIWYISKYLAPPGPTGVGSRGFWLMHELANLDHTVAIITSDANHLATAPRLNRRFHREDRDGLSLYWVRTIKYGSVKSVRRVLSWLHFDIGVFFLQRRIVPKPSVVVVSSLSLTSVIVGAWIAWRYRARFLFEVRDIWPLTLTEEGGFSHKNLLVRLLGVLERWGYENAHAIVGTMPNLVQHVREVSRSRRPVFCVPMGYDPMSLCESSDLPKEYQLAGIPEDRFLVGYAGSVGATNALETLLECAENMIDNTSIHFVIVGGGDLLREFVAKYEGRQNITFVGKVPRDTIQAVLAEFDLLYLSTFDSKVWSFGQSLNKIIDYMLSARPIVASYSGFPSMINEAGSGTFVPAENAAALESEIQRLAALDPSELQEMGRRGREWVLENRSYSALALQYERVMFAPLN